jgi:hypothetical protein
MLAPPAPAPAEPLERLHGGAAVRPVFEHHAGAYGPAPPAVNALRFVHGKVGLFFKAHGKASLFSLGFDRAPQSTLTDQFVHLQQNFCAVSQGTRFDAWFGKRFVEQ